jgi:hypothetical protein
MARVLKPWSDADIRRRCLTLREQLQLAASDVVSAAELADYWPGGKENTVAERRGQWIYCYANLTRFSDRLRAEYAAVDTRDAERARVDAQQDAPVAVPLTNGTTVHVHPLGYVALEFLTTLDRTVTLAQEQAAAVALQRSPASEQALALQPLVRSHAVRLWAWILTSGHPYLPFSPTIEDPEPPEWTGAMDVEDLLRLYAAHREVNARRNMLIAALFPPDTSSEVRLSLAGFIGAYAHEKGKDAAVLMRTFTLGKLFAQAVSAAQQHEAAMASAKKAKPVGDD